jgi:hypothetical protein
MKIVCINNKGWSSLTLGKTYDVIGINMFSEYIIINDISEEYSYIKERFKLLSEIRNEKINKLLNDESKIY